jgi:arsenate reductase
MPNVLFLCTGNSARSILGEAILNHLGNSEWTGFSAGSKPVGQVNPHALALLQARGHAITGLASKRWDVFSGPVAPAMDLIITVCDSAAGEACPAWPGHPMTSHWGMPDPAAVTGDDAAIGAAFAETYHALHRRLSALLTLPLADLSGNGAKAAIDRIGAI